MGNPLVSIIVPCYNVEKYIEECVMSVISQDYENWECLLINDGSNDNTLNLLESLSSIDRRINVYSQENLGLSATRNRGIDIAKGEFLFFLDSDDVLDHKAIRTLVFAFQNNDIITGITVNTTFSEGKITKVSQLYTPKEGHIIFANQNFEVLKKAMQSALTPTAQNRLYSRDFVNRHNLRFKEGILHEDELWFFETMLFARNVKFVNKETYFYRIDNQDSITKNVGDRNLESYILVMECIVKNYSQHQQFHTIASWYSVYMKKIFLDFAIRERSKLSDQIISRLESALKDFYVPLGEKVILSMNNDIYYRTINKLSLKGFDTIAKYFFRNPINSFRKIKNIFKISYFLK